jgi:branched-chain amino acid transport system ATP-binding protein
MLRVERLEAGYGDVPVLHGVSLEVGAGEIVALVGSNGAGKSTLLKTLAGLLPATAGEVEFDGAPITGLKAYRRVQLGIALVPEGRRLFAGLTVRQNLLLGAFQRRDQAAIDADLARVYALFPRLKEREDQLAGRLSGGEQQMCAIGRGLMAAPRLLLIDELSLGLAPVAVDALLAALQAVHAQGTPLLLVEQDVRTALGIADRAYVVESGQVTIHGPARTLLADPRIKQAYLGL